MTVTHGLAGTYRSRRYQCRCEPCTVAHRERQNREKKDRAARLTADPSLAPHGTTSTYLNWGCRCKACVQANTDRCHEYKRERRRDSRP